MNKRLFLDTADPVEVQRWAEAGVISGVTTNPSLMAKQAKGDYLKRLLEVGTTLADATYHGPTHLSVEVTTLDPKEMVRQALELRDGLHGQLPEHVHVYVKVPVLVQTLSVVSTLSREGVALNATAVFTAVQAKLAQDAGADIVSFFYNRMLDDGIQASTEIWTFHNRYRTTADVICGSIRKPEDVPACWSAGADIVTASPAVVEALVRNKGSEASAAKFQQDIENWLA